ncbi:hypothetical protein [Prochlorococcus sp. MIT 1306]|uniref:hypothetical protein n=1 Tax=Prochlorococcus sp. MIT 1306 TaxID=1799667 RepID=UPI0007B3A662|nr:hypothetical protein [Prochlorococcus sp. MIT 1306]KZR66519.1 hypothetical protein PMIT1306_00105 [Prochlorococcus sp. MIT 1306]
MKLTNQASTRATLLESDNAFLTSPSIESQEVSPKVEAAFSDLKLKDPLVNTFEQNQPLLDQLQDNLFVDIGFNADDINVNLDMIDISPLENLQPPIREHDLLTEFDQSMLFDAKDMINMMNEIKDMAMSTAGAGWEGNHGTTWDGPFTGETQAGDSWSQWEGEGFDTYWTHNGEETTEEEYKAAKAADDNGEYYTPSYGSSNSSDDDDGGGGFWGKVWDWLTGGDDDTNGITHESEAGKGMGRIYAYVDDLVPETLATNHIEEIDVSAHQMPMFVGVQQATTHLF